MPLWLSSSSKHLPRVRGYLRYYVMLLRTAALDEHAFRMHGADVSARRPPLTRGGTLGETTFFKINDDERGRIGSAAIRWRRADSLRRDTEYIPMLIDFVRYLKVECSICLIFYVYDLDSESSSEA